MNKFIPSGIFPKFWKSVPLFCVFLRKTHRCTCHITDLEQLLKHFKLKTSSSKTPTPFPYAVAEHSYSTYAKNPKTLQLFLIFFKNFYLMSESHWKMRGKILPERNFSKNSYIKSEKLHLRCNQMKVTFLCKRKTPEITKIGISPVGQALQVAVDVR